MSVDVITDEKSFKIHVDEKTNLRNQCKQVLYCVQQTWVEGWMCVFVGGGGGGEESIACLPLYKRVCTCISQRGSLSSDRE